MTSLAGQVLVASTVMVPMAWSTRFTTPAARSAWLASSATLPKLAAVRSEVEDFRAVAGDVPHHEVHVLEVAVRRQALDLAKALHVHQPPAEAAQGAAADAAAADVLHRVLIDVEEGGAGAHGDHQRRLPPGQGQRALAHGVELVHLGGGDAVNVPVHKGGALAGETRCGRYRAGQSWLLAMIAAHGSKEGGELVLCPWMRSIPRAVPSCLQAHHLGGGAANVDAENDTPCLMYLISAGETRVVCRSIIIRKLAKVNGISRFSPFLPQGKKMRKRLAFPRSCPDNRRSESGGRTAPAPPAEHGPGRAPGGSRLRCFIERGKAEPEPCSATSTSSPWATAICKAGYQDRITYFDVFFRNVPDNGGFAICRGPGPVHRLCGEPPLLRGGHRVPPEQEGSSPRNSWTICGTSSSPATSGPCPRARPSSPGEPILTVAGPGHRGPAHGDLLSCCASTTRASSPPRPTASSGRRQGRTVLEFGSRRAQGDRRRRLRRPGRLHRRLQGHRLHHLGPSSTACLPAAPWPTPGCRCSTAEYEAFKTYCEIYPRQLPCCWWIPTTP